MFCFGEVALYMWYFIKKKFLKVSMKFRCAPSSVWHTDCSPYASSPTLPVQYSQTGGPDMLPPLPVCSFLLVLE